MYVTRGGGRNRVLLDVAAALIAPAVALVFATLTHTLFGVTILSLLFLAAVTVVASIRGSRAAVIAAVIGVIFYRLFLDLRIGEATSAVEDIINLVIFLVVALITGNFGRQSTRLGCQGASPC